MNNTSDFQFIDAIINNARCGLPWRGDIASTSSGVT